MECEAEGNANDAVRICQEICYYSIEQQVFIGYGNGGKSGGNRLRKKLPCSVPVDWATPFFPSIPSEGGDGLLSSSADPTIKLDPHGENRPFLTTSRLIGSSLSGCGDGLIGKGCDVSTITDISNQQDLPEIEIISLIEDHIPRYRLRADTLTTFSGYENEDWFIPAPALPVDSDVDLSPEQAEETLKYFALCANRVSQMTKTYNDIDAVTRLLEEKEKDLELAARIGQSLLSRNKTLEQKHEQLEQEVAMLTEQVTQLRHDLTMKSDLLQIYAQDLDCSESDSSAGSPTRDRLSLHINWEVLQKKVRQLEEENLALRSEATELDFETVNFEEKEQQLVKDCVRQLAEANAQVNQLSDELSRKIDDNLRQQEEITSLLAQVVDTQKKFKRVHTENEDMQNHLHAAKECQQELTVELADFKEKYAEVVDLLHEAQEHLRTSRKKSLPNASGRPYSLYSPYVNPDSLASELENSIGMMDPLFEGIAHNEKQQHNLKVFETVRCARQRKSSLSTSPTYTASSYGVSTSHLSHLYNSSPATGFTSLTSSGYSSGGLLSVVRPSSMPGMGRPVGPSPSAPTIGGSTGPSSLEYASQSDSEGSVVTDNYHTDDDSLYSSMSSSLGRPGIPGSNDLETALRRLSLRRQSEHEFQLHDRRRLFDSGSEGIGCRTPDSIMSTGSLQSAFSGGSGPMGYRHYHMPEKLQIIKPMEGSLTLHHWQRLATPHLGGIFEERPGVQTKGERKLEDLDDVYTLTDYEEDEDYTHPGKRFEDTGSIYTYTTSTVMHPDDNTRVTPSLPTTQMSVNINSQPGSVLNSPQGRERATSTFSTTFGLASLLNERGISAALPTVVSRPPSPTCAYSPTATPCNSPEGSPPASPPPFSPLRLPSLMAMTSGMSRGADLLRRSIKSRSKSRRATTTTSHTTGTATVPSASLTTTTTTVSSSISGLGNINLLEKVNRIGLENIMATSSASMVDPVSSLAPSLPTNLFVNRASPMAQLTSMRRLTMPLTVNTGSPAVVLPVSSSSPAPPVPSFMAHDLGTIGTLPSLRKGGLL